MNSAVIIKIEFKLQTDENFTVLDFIPYSGKISDQVSTTRPGDFYNTTVNFNIAKAGSATDTILKTFKNRKAQFRITDANSAVHLVGNDDWPARLLYQKALDGAAGSFNGYRCTISCQSPTGIVTE